MAKRCPQCGNFLMDDERFCTRCGANFPDMVQTQNDHVDLSKNMNYQQYNNAGQQFNTPGQSYGTANYSGQTGGTQSSGGTPMRYVSSSYEAPVNNTQLTTGQWVLTIILTTFFGLISIIILFVWGFGDGPESRRRYCKAMLIVELISVVLSVVLMILFSTLFTGILEGIMSEIYSSGDFSDYYQYYQNLPDSVSAFFSALFTV